jgi:signal peptide peptidase SppA
MKHAILAAMLREPWAIEPWKLAEIIDVVVLAIEQPDMFADISARLTKGRERETSRMDGAVFIAPLHGTIANRMNVMDAASGGTSSEMFGQQFSAAVKSPAVKAIVLDVDSPGGMVAGTDELSSLIHSARGQKPVIAHVNSRAASAAYWIASAADEVVVSPSASVGSIGVLTAHDDVSKAMERMGIQRTVIASSKFKAEGHPWAPLDEVALAHIRRSVDKSHASFVKAVARNRKTSQANVNENFGQGRMVDAEDAIAAGMADKIGTLDQTLARFGASLPASSQRRAIAYERETRALRFRQLVGVSR